MREIQGMASAMAIGVQAAPPSPDARNGAFAATLRTTLDPTIATGSPDALSATRTTDALLAQMAGAQGLGVESMLASAPVQGQPVANSRLTGDLDGLDPELRASLEQVAAQLGRSIEVVSGARTRSEQEVLYQKYLDGTGNLAAVPGTSRHESGRAADVYVDGVALADVPGGRAAASALGLGFPVPGEAWHIEPVR
ncbi:MAG: penicillin-resistant DD-carboxypeptidase [Thermoleophilia bacterium]|nr:penicillin-resistant DD-carboxypeptidase [Thermoleophilia bacterium]